MTAQLTQTGFEVASDGTVTATAFVGPLTGNASTATLAATASLLAGGVTPLSPFTLAAPQQVDMAGAAHALVNGTAGAGQTKVLGTCFGIDANRSGGGTSPQALTLPAVIDGRLLMIVNSGGEDITLDDAFSSTLAAGKGILLVGAVAAGKYIPFLIGA